MQAQPQLQASGTINPNRFVAKSGVRQGAQAGDNEAVIGASGQSTKFPPLEDLVTTNPHAVAGEPIAVFGMGDIVAVEAGAAIDASSVEFVKSDANGRAVPVATTGAVNQNVAARPLESAAAAGELIMVQLMFDTIRPALS
ncbi:MAG: hypothetical protein AAF589_03445 [Planctomycetota bacterium]